MPIKTLRGSTRGVTMNCISKYKNRVNRKGKNLKERITNEGKSLFLRHTKESPNGYTVQVTDIDEVSITDKTKWVSCFVTNVTLNDQNSLDEKYIHFDLDVNVEVGCYVRWYDEYWVIVFKELNTITTHKTFTMKKCNQIFSFKKDNIIYNIPVSVTNLTLYSDGLSKNTYITRQDSKRSILVGKNSISKLIQIGTRIMLTNSTVFRVTHIDNFTQNGLLKLTALQMALLPEDDIENNIAYNNNNDNYNSTPIESDDLIISPKIAYLGQDLALTINDKFNDVEVEWSLISKNNSAIITKQDTKSCEIKVIGDSRHIGQILIVEAYDISSFNVLETKMITIKGYF